MEINIKNMVCPRCVSSVESIFRSEGIAVKEIILGRVVTEEELEPAQVGAVREALAEQGFEWLDDPKTRLVEEIRRSIIELVQSGELDGKDFTLSAYLARKLHRDYHSLSLLFSSIESTTIEQFFILQKIEKIKEWLVYNEDTLSEMAFRMGYSSVAHLSAQFKRITGFTPTEFRRQKGHLRRPIDGI
ncbi:MAG: helix-turn-helix domain-containing protein [Chitinophagaceae bacterium]